MSEMVGIRPEHTLAAAHAHFDRTQIVGPRPIDRILASVGVVDIDDFRALGQSLQELRDPEGAGSRTAAWDAGFIDGFILGARSLSIALGLDDFEAMVERMAEAYLSTDDPFDGQEDFRVALRAALNLGGGS